MTETDLAYIAGLFDGEGCVLVAKAARTNGKQYYTLLTNISNKDLRCLRFSQERFGGRINVQRSSQVGRWALTSNRAARFLKAILPYLVIKKDQAEKAIEYQAWRCARQGSETRRNTPQTKESVAMDQDFRAQLKLMKRIG